MSSSDGDLIQSHQELDVYSIAYNAAMTIFHISGDFPKEEMYSLTDQIRRSSRAVCANIAEAWRKRRYKDHFRSKLSDAEGEAAETQTWIEFAVDCQYMKEMGGEDLEERYDHVIGKLVNMIDEPEPWILG